jgi:hypothetical protein
MMPGSSACNANSFNGAGHILKTVIVTCGTGLQISAICGALGAFHPLVQRRVAFRQPMAQSLGLGE